MSQVSERKANWMNSVWGEQIYHATREHNDLKELSVSQVLVRNLQVASDRNPFPTSSTEKV